MGFDLLKLKIHVCLSNNQRILIRKLPLFALALCGPITLTATSQNPTSTHEKQTNKQTNPKLNACTKAPAKILKTNSVVVPATVGVLGLHF